MERRRWGERLGEERREGGRKERTKEQMNEQRNKQTILENDSMKNCVVENIEVQK